MTEKVVTASEDMRLTDVMKLLLNRRISGLPVVNEEGMLLGIVTEHDLVNFIVSGSAPYTKVSEVMVKNVKTYTPDTLFIDIVNDFVVNRIRRIPIVESEKVVGIVSRRDIIREMVRTYNRILAKSRTENAL